MKKYFKIFVSGILFASLIIGISLSHGFEAKALSLNTATCSTNIKGGWNLVSLGELACGLMALNNGQNYPSNFPAYLDIYAYDGSDYVHGRVYKGRALDDSFENSAERFLTNRVKKITNGQYNDLNRYMSDVENWIGDNDSPKISGLAQRLARETFTSVWVYNPSGEFNVTYKSKYDDEAFSLSLINLAFGDISSSEYSALTNYAEGLSGEIYRELQREPGLGNFLKKLFSGNVAIDSGWNFMTYSKVLSNNSEKIDLNSGNCNITKAYVFDDSNKKWVNLSDANSSMVNSGMVIYNNGSVCTLSVKNSFLDLVSRLLGGGTLVNPPALPN